MTIQELIDKLESFPKEMKVSICTDKYDEYFDIKSFQFDDLGKGVEIQVKMVEDEY